MSSGPTIAAAIAPTTPASTSHNGGFLSSVNAIPGVSTLEHGAHVVEHGIGVGLSKTADVAQSVGTGIYTSGQQALGGSALDMILGHKPPVSHPSFAKLANEYGLFVTDPGAEAKGEYNTDPFVHSQVQSVAALAHPGRDPLQTALAAGFILLPTVASVVARGAYLASVARAAKVGDTGLYVALGSKAADAAAADGHVLTPLTASEKSGLIAKAVNPTYRVPMPTRFLHVPGDRVVTDEEGNAVGTRPVTDAVQLSTSQSPLYRGAQAILDKRLQAGLNRSIPGVTALAHTRVAGLTDELARTTVETKQALELGLQRASRMFGRGFDRGVSMKMGNLAILLRSAQGAPEDAVALWRGGDSAAQKAWAKVAGALVDKGVLTRGDDGRLIVDAGRYPKLAAADELVRQAQAEGESLIEQHGLMTPEGQQTRLNLVGRVLAGGKWGESQAVKAVGDDIGQTVRQIGKGYDLGKLTHVDANGVATVYTRWGVKSLPLDALELPGKRGIQGGEHAAAGEGFTSLRTMGKPAPRTSVAAARLGLGKIAKPKPPSLGPEATGEGFRAANIPVDTIAGVNAHLSMLNRYDQTVKIRERLWNQGSDTRQSTTQILSRDPFGSGEPRIPLDLQKDLGMVRDLTDKEISRGTEQGVRAAIEDRLNLDFPGRDPDSHYGQLEKTADLGTHVPGYRWVEKRMVPASARTAAVTRSIEGKGIDNLNTAVVAATVYLRVGHIPTRTATNAFTSLISGALNPPETRACVQLARQMTAQERREVVGMSGPGGYRGVLPEQMQGASMLGRGVGKTATGFHRLVTGSANWWHVHIDTPFREVNMFHALRQEGIDTPEAVRKAIRYVKEPTLGRSDPVFVRKLTSAILGGRRSSIMYDGLNNFERRLIGRLIWFYPWVKGATRYAFHVAAEHPVKAFAVAQAGAQGSQERGRALGLVPNYELPLTPLSGGATPWTANFSSYTPIGTIGQVADLVQHPLNPDTGIVGNLNPALSAILAAASGKNLLGAAGKLLQPTPEAQVFTNPPKPTSVFGDTIAGHHALSELLRALGGAGVARPTNKTALNLQGQRQREKKRTVTIYGP